MSTSTLHPVSLTRHQHKGWSKPDNYRWTASHLVCVLSANEVVTACMSLAVGFMKTADGHFMPHGILGVGSDRNLMLNRDGSWGGPYLPKCYNSYPLLLGKNSEDSFVLCVEENSGLISDSGAGLKFFDAEGKATPELTQAFAYLQEHEHQKATTQTLCTLLAKYDLIQPWKISIQQGGELRQFEGLYRIDEAKLNALTPEAIVELHKATALMLAHAQLLSMQHLAKLGKNAEQRMSQDVTRPKQFATAPVHDFDDGNGIISFDKLFGSN